MDGNHADPDEVFADYATAIPDANLRLAIEDTVGKSFGSITWGDLHSITMLNADNPMSDLSGIEYCANIFHLNVSMSGNRTGIVQSA